MNPSKRLAQLIGPTLVAVTVSETLNIDIWRVNLPPVTYLNGFILFVAGLTIVREHNYWTRTWTVLVTLVGWAAIVGGLFRMFAPSAPQGAANPITFAVIALLFAIGLVLTFQGYRKGA